MSLIVLAVNPVVQTLGLLGAIIICLFALVFVLITLAFNLAAAFGLGWLREKATIVQKLRPSVDSINTVTEAAVQGVPPSEKQNAVVRTAATIPERMNAIDKKVEQSSNRVASAVIEFHARAIQVGTITKAFLLPGLTTRKRRQPALLTDGSRAEFNSPGYRALAERQAPEIPLIPATVASEDQKGQIQRQRVSSSARR